MGQRTADINAIEDNCYQNPTEIIIPCNFPEYYLKVLPSTKYYQTENANESVCIIEDPDGSISIGFARAGRSDKESGRITSEDGLDIAKGRAEKARKLKTPLIERNYVRGIYLPKINKDI